MLRRSSPLLKKEIEELRELLTYWKGVLSSGSLKGNGLHLVRCHIQKVKRAMYVITGGLEGSDGKSMGSSKGIPATESKAA